MKADPTDAEYQRGLQAQRDLYAKIGAAADANDAARVRTLLAEYDARPVPGPQWGLGWLAGSIVNHHYLTRLRRAVQK